MSPRRLLFVRSRPFPHSDNIRMRRLAYDCTTERAPNATAGLAPARRLSGGCCCHLIPLARTNAASTVTAITRDHQSCVSIAVILWGLPACRPVRRRRAASRPGEQATCY